MEKIETEPIDEATRSKSAIRCARAAILLSSLKSSQNRDLRATVAEQSQEEERLRKSVGDLKIELAMERVRNNRIKLCGLMEFVLQFVLVLSLSSFFVFVAFALI